MRDCSLNCANAQTDLTESLEQQTATSEVLQVISSSADELDLVFQVMLKNAVRICDAAFGNIYRWDGKSFRLLATHKTPPAFAEASQALAASSWYRNSAGSNDS